MCGGGGGNLSLNGEQSHDDKNTENGFFTNRQLLFENLNMPKDDLTVAEGQVRAR